MMSASVATGASLKAHDRQPDAARMETGRRLSISPDADDQDSSFDFEDELQQELENEMTASYSNLFSDDGEDDGDSRSATGVSFAGGLDADTFSDDGDGSAPDDNEDRDAEDSEASDEDDDEVDEDDNVGADGDNVAANGHGDLFGSHSIADSDDEEDLDLDFEDPPDSSARPATNGTHARLDHDSASDDEFEAVDFDLDMLHAELESGLHGPSAAAVPTMDSAPTSPRKRKRYSVHIGDIDLLGRYGDERPSLTIHLFDSHFRFEGQEGVFLYNGPMRFFFDALNEGKIPVDLVDVLALVNCRYFDGCLIVEVRDHRRPVQELRSRRQRGSDLFTWPAVGDAQAATLKRYAMSLPGPDPPQGPLPDPSSMAAAAAAREAAAADAVAQIDRPTSAECVKIYKKVMRPTPETVHLDLLLAVERSRAKLSQEDMLSMEGMILLAVEQPLDLEPDFQISRLSNATRYVEYGHLLPRQRRKYNSAEIEAERAEREEKMKLLTLMDDRSSRDFQPSFTRVSQVNEWRQKKLGGDAEVYPAALPPMGAGKKTVAKKGRSQMSTLPDGRRTIRTLRYIQTATSGPVHTTFHVMELPESQSLQGVLRWGSLPDSAVNGGTRVFTFPNESIMRMHIDNLKLLLGIENNRLIYDSAYPHGQPTAGPPPIPSLSPPAGAVATASASPSAGSTPMSP
ncbi:Transcription factor spt20, partial [Coemansia helicoidea]